MIQKVERWAQKPLVDVATLQRGHDLPVQDRVPGPYPVFAANGPVGLHSQAKAKGPGVVTGRSGTIGQVDYIEGDYWPLNTALYVVNFHGNHPRFVYYLLQQLQLERYYQGTGVPTLNRNNIHQLAISVPPVPEQHRLADILDEADALRQKRAEAIQLANDLVPSVFFEMFGEVVRQPSSSNRLRFIKALALPLRNGLSPSNSGAVSGQVLTLSAITGDEFDASALKQASFAREFSDSDLVNETDFLICRGNGNVNLVAAGKFPKDVPAGVAFPDTIIAARIDTAIVTREFLETVWALPIVRRQLLGVARTTSGIHKINQTMLEKLEIPYVDVSKQQRFAAVLRDLKSIGVATKSSQTELDNLFHSLLQRAFRGEL